MNYEKKFITLSFLIIFSLLFIVIFFINRTHYFEYKHFLKDNIKKEFQICSYTLKCKNIKVDFIPKSSNITPFKLIETKNSLYMLFDIPKIKNYYLKLSIDKKEYQKKLDNLKYKILQNFLIELFVIILLAILFTYLLLIPLKKAYELNEIFIKDIIHDLNTPLTALKLNLYLLKRECKSKRIATIENSIQRILKYQENLKNYLEQNPNQKEEIDIKKLIDEKLEFYSYLYPNITYKNNIKSYSIKINKHAFSSIIDNIISNAFKYNKTNGSIEIDLKDNKLIIKDTGKGIANTKKVFDRFYKEQERGIGIGMSIVKKLSTELNIPIKIESKKDKGTTIILDLSKYQVTKS